jgi:hypothetical protein
MVNGPFQSFQLFHRCAPFQPFEAQRHVLLNLKYNR